MKTKFRIRLLALVNATVACFSLVSLSHAQTVLWSDALDDVNVNDRWYTDFGIWQIGSPTIGPGTNPGGCRAHSCPNCATTGLTANYPSGADSRLIRFQSFTVPPANQYPRLRFWQWYNFSSAHGQVEIKGTNGVWQAISPAYTGTGGDWTYASVDLSFYSGQTVQVAFHLVADCCGGSAPGWYVDDIAVLTGAPVFNNPEGWENGLGDWYAETGTWQVGVATKSGGPLLDAVGYQAHSGSNCAVTLLKANYPSGVDSRLVSPPITIPPANQFPRLRFWQWYNFSSEHGQVEVKGTNDAWQVVSPAYTGSGGDWTHSSLDLRSYAGQTIQVAFHLVADCCGGSAQGWYVDDVALLTGTPLFNNPEGWENGLGDWYAETGTWQVGMATKGGGPPLDALGYQAHSGSNCAVTLLNAYYPSGVDSRLVSPPINVAPATQFPRLRFWQWYNFSSEHGQVEVKGTNGAWQVVSPAYTGTGGGWTYASVDLSSYAGQTVQVAFHLVADCCGGSAQGWYVDDVALLTGTPVFNNPEGWENGLGDWYAETGTWQVGIATKSGGPPRDTQGYQAHSGSNCAATLLNANYPSGVDSRLVSPPINVPPATQFPRLRFWHWYSFSSEHGQVELRVGNGNWQVISPSPQYTGTSGGWTEPLLDLSSYGGQTVQIAFHLVADCCGGSAQGWYVDDISLQSSGAPVVITPPASETNLVGTTALFNVSASGDLPLSYQWRYNWTAIAGATNVSLSLPNVQLAQSGYYDVVITNDAGAITSTPPSFLSVVIGLTGVVINDPGENGSSTNYNGTYTVRGSGEGTDGTADIFYFDYQPLAGDAQIIARLDGMQGGDPSLAEAGVMIRETLDPGSKQVSLSVNASTNAIFRRRLAYSDFSIQNSFHATNFLQPPNHVWLRLMRLGNTFIGHYSTDGLNWQYLWFTSMNMSNQVLVGLAVTAHHYGETNTATFDNLYLGNLTPLSGGWPLPGPQLLQGGQDWSSAEFQRVGGFEFLVGGPVGDFYAINGAANVTTPSASWSLLGTVTNIYGVVPFVDVSALTNQTQFYRAKRLGP